MNQNDNIVTTAILTDAENMAKLNNQIYPKEWHVSPEYLKKIIKRNPEVYRIYKTRDDIKGIYGFFPLTESNYHAVLEGTLEENEIADYILDYSQSKKVYLYLITIIVDIYDDNRKEYASKLIKDIPRELNRLKTKGITIKEVGAFAVSADGEKLLPKIGFEQQKGETIKLNNHKYPVFRAKTENILENIKI
ncbi:hypothetical protein [Niallia sp. Krafla_26]|uniref:hypothetical protein n=1 Tax=Niallia sp. Krafla_26 TaxID=3064703 RepID=UPI003D166204